MEITAEIVADFRAYLPAFADTTKWSDGLITQTLEDADAETGGCGWGLFEIGDGHNFKRRGMYLYAAHYLAVTYPGGNADGASVSGSAKFATQSKTVGDESVTYNNGALSSMGAGDAWLASSNFGQQFLRLRRRAGRGALAV